MKCSPELGTPPFDSPMAFPPVMRAQTQLRKWWQNPTTPQPQVTTMSDFVPDDVQMVLIGIMQYSNNTVAGSATTLWIKDTGGIWRKLGALQYQANTGNYNTSVQIPMFIPRPKGGWGTLGIKSTFAGGNKNKNYVYCNKVY